MEPQTCRNRLSHKERNGFTFLSNRRQPKSEHFCHEIWILPSNPLGFFDMTNDVGTPEWIEKNNLILSRLETSDDANMTPIELGVELSSLDRQFTLHIDDTGVQIKNGISPRCNLRIKIPDATASEIHQGTLSVAEAITNGEIKIAGDINALMQSSGTLSQLSKALQNKLA